MTSRRDWTDATLRKKIARLYADGLTTAVLRERWNDLSGDILREICDEYGVRMRGRSERPL